MIADGNDRGVYSSIANFGDSDFFFKFRCCAAKAKWRACTTLLLALGRQEKTDKIVYSSDVSVLAVMYVLPTLIVVLSSHQCG